MNFYKLASGTVINLYNITAVTETHVYFACGSTRVSIDYLEYLRICEIVGVV